MLDCSAASENLLLAAESMGLGAVWTAVYPENDRIAKVRSVLSLPDHIIPFNLITVGYPQHRDCLLYTSSLSDTSPPRADRYRYIRRHDECGT